MCAGLFVQSVAGRISGLKSDATITQCGRIGHRPVTFLSNTILILYI